MRIMIKGGIWKNTEDEILKAAVMKYGKNQWARISSLLVRKSAKQCKARWYEWLDPSIKKTDWTREEDEKLLHLAKLMPTQWRTIAPIVGRTPSQCLERYEKLLDAACAKDENYEPGDDPRKLRPGEMDPNPESKPARPDPVDMDEDEKEMLSEARARLANTRGKKAKRKAREKQLEEARRLASLQKRRELKAAGIQTRHRKRKRRGIDYNAEIPFEKKPPPGFFDVVDEDRPVEQPKFPTTIEELEGKRRVDIEAQLRKQDIAKNKIAQRQDAPSAILQANKLNDPETVRKRSKLMLPPPQISDHELEEIAKMGYASHLAGSGELAEGSGATRALLANYAQTPRQGMTPLHTPQRTPAGKGDAIMMEAENLARLRESRTPLLGGDNPELHPSDFSGVTPRKREIQTPNPMLTPSATPGGVGLTPRLGMTPTRDGYSFGLTPKGTPLRDELNINEDMDMRDNIKLEQRRQADLRMNLRSGLSNLPLPRNEYDIVVRPAADDIEEPQEDKIEEDMSDRIARDKAEEEARQQALLRKRSKVLQRELPRPPAASLELIRNSLTRADEDKSSYVPPTLIEQADEMIRRELLNLLEHDNAKYPLDDKTEKEKRKGVKRSAGGKPTVSVPVIEDFEEDEMKEADDMIKEEAVFLHAAMGHQNESLDEFIEAHKTCLSDLMYFPPRNAYGLSSVAGVGEKLAALQNEFENVKKGMDDDNKKAQRLENKIKLLTQGYQIRAEKLWLQIESTFKQVETASTELECFQALQKQEKLAASLRINSLWEDVQKQKELENTLQRRYADVLAERERLENLVREYRRQAQVEEEITAKDRAQQLADQTPLPSVGTPENEANCTRVDSSDEGTREQVIAGDQIRPGIPENDASSTRVDSSNEGTPEHITAADQTTLSRSRIPENDASSTHVDSSNEGTPEHITAADQTTLSRSGILEYDASPTRVYSSDEGTREQIIAGDQTTLPRSGIPENDASPTRVDSFDEGTHEQITAADQTVISSMETPENEAKCMLMDSSDEGTREQITAPDQTLIPTMGSLGNEANCTRVNSSDEGTREQIIAGDQITLPRSGIRENDASPMRVDSSNEGTREQITAADQTLIPTMGSPENEANCTRVDSSDERTREQIVAGNQTTLPRSGIPENDANCTRVDFSNEETHEKIVAEGDQASGVVHIQVSGEKNDANPDMIKPEDNVEEGDDFVNGDAAEDHRANMPNLAGEETAIVEECLPHGDGVVKETAEIADEGAES